MIGPLNPAWMIYSFYFAEFEEFCQEPLASYIHYNFDFVNKIWFIKIVLGIAYVVISSYLQSTIKISCKIVLQQLSLDCNF